LLQIKRRGFDVGDPLVAKGYKSESARVVNNTKNDLNLLPRIAALGWRKLPFAARLENASAHHSARGVALEIVLNLIN